MHLPFIGESVIFLAIFILSWSIISKYPSCSGRDTKSKNQKFKAFMPWLLNKILKFGYEDKFMKQFLPVINQLANIVRSGSTIEEAFSTIANENPDPIGKEFRLMLSEYRISHDLSESLRKLSSRIKNSELALFVNSILISKKTGANIIEQLEKIQRTISDRLYIEGRIKSLTIQGKIQGVSTALLPLVIIFCIRLIDPSYFDPILKTKMGNILIYLAIFMIAIGALLIIRITKIRY